MQAFCNEDESLSARACIRVVVIDDHPAIREALTCTLNGMLDVVVCGEAGSAAEALALLGRVAADVAIVDVSLGDVDGLDLVRAIRKDHPGVQVVVFSMYDERMYAVGALRAGALAYLMKSASTRKVVEAVRCVYRREVFLSQEMVSRIARSTPASGHRLTGREKDILQLMGRGCNTRQIADELNIKVKTAETYRRQVKEKLGLGKVSDLLWYALNWSES